jgi:IMP cyclohydrolase
MGKIKSELNATLAESNFRWLEKNEYPGRGLVAGLDDTSSHLVQVYWIMGRSENSQNRVFSNKAGRLYTEAANPKLVKDPSLIIYNAMLESSSRRDFIVSNGTQTDAVTKTIESGAAMEHALRQQMYEPDSPNYTQRITGISSRADAVSVQLFIQRKSRFGDGCDRVSYRYDELGAGYGFCITTYAGDGTPLPSFRDDPRLMPLTGSMKDIASSYWAALNVRNRVSLAVKFIDIAEGSSTLHIINQYKKVAA